MEKKFAINLKKYIEQDKIYQDYKKGKLEDKSDFDEFCINHCEDIENVLDEILKLRIKISTIDTINNELDNENQELKEEFAKLWYENNKLKELCDKYEEEHKTTFEYWKHLIKEDYKTRIDKAIEYIEARKKEREKGNEYAYDIENRQFIRYCNELYNLLKGDNK